MRSHSTRFPLGPSFRSHAHPLPHPPCRRWTLILCVILLLASWSGCADDRPDDPVDALSAAERVELDAFIESIRVAYVDGNGPAVAAMISREGMPEFLEAIMRARYVPKGPSKVVSTRVEPLEGASEMVVELREVEYRLNVDPLGVLVLELDDVSIGKLEVEMIFGRSGGRFQLAGLKPNA